MASPTPARGNPQLRRRSIFEGFAPADFVRPGTGEWPFGDLYNALLNREPRHADAAAAARWREEADVAYRAVRELALFTQWWLQFRTRKRISQETAARRLRVSRPRLADLEDGKNFSDWDLPWRIKGIYDASPEPPDSQPPSPGRR